MNGRRSLSSAPLKVGIAGYGIVGRRRRSVLDNHPDFEVVTACDRVFNEVSAPEDGLQYYTNYQDMLDECDLDVLLVCMTNDIAPEVTIAGLELGLHVFCEKPPGRDVDDIRKVRIVEKKCPKLKLMYGFNHRHHESVQEAFQIIKSGELGSLLNLKGTYGKSQIVTFDQDDWRTKRAISGGGVLLDQGIHMVDLMRLFAGEFEEFHSFISNSQWNFEVEDNAYALMRTSDGIIGMLHSSATQWRHRFSLEIALTKGSLILGGILSGSKSYGAETLTIVKADPDNDAGAPKETKIRYNKDPSWEAEIKAFSEAVLDGKLIDHGTSDDALKTMECVYNIYCADQAWKNKHNLSV